MECSDERIVWCDVIIEVCVDSANASFAAQQQGASRVELCVNLDVGGTTPNASTIMQTVQRCTIAVHVMIRPRGGDFQYTENELSQMQKEIRLAASLGAKGVVFGVLTATGEIDEASNHMLLQTARELGLQVTFHRAFDECVDAARGLETIIKMRVDNLLTSGQRESAYAGRDMLTRLSKQAAGRINLIAAAGVGPENAVEIARCGMQALHFTARRKSTQARDGHVDPTWEFDAQKVRRVVDCFKNQI